MFYGGDSPHVHRRPTYVGTVSNVLVLSRPRDSWFFITQIHRARFVSVNGRASRVKPSRNKFWKKVGKKFLEKKFWKKVLEKRFDRKNVGKINYKGRIFINKIYSNIDKCHTIFALLADILPDFLNTSLTRYFNQRD